MAVVMAVSALGFDEEYAITPLEPTAMDLWPGRPLYSLKLVEVQPIKLRAAAKLNIALILIFMFAVLTLKY
ncbi:hypothetical protein CA160_01320 [Vibrio parahaemolyticus]|nr:hypothetical protein YA91_16945 [Vibrio parahaemolyticus]EGR1752101.1 hypothetical protein [Vibrio parahaemolyticus]EGR1960345.1 hypothetical protein [Vibrio parahaemolyticus]EGR1970918.1 hypothetical protein [Vibrio parahaemolyticus]ODW51792.1 hypothetical protein BBL86_09905 [Vibrio parahaemolyticus]